MSAPATFQRSPHRARWARTIAGAALVLIIASCATGPGATAQPVATVTEPPSPAPGASVDSSDNALESQDLEWRNVGREFRPTAPDRRTQIMQLQPIGDSILAVGTERPMTFDEGAPHLGVAWRSDNGGASWTRTGPTAQTSSGQEGANFTAVAALGDAVVIFAVEVNSFSDQVSDAVFVSRDLEEWTRAELPEPMTNGGTRLGGTGVNGDRLFGWWEVPRAGEGQPGLLWATDDGLSWTQIEPIGLPIALNHAELTSVDGRLVLISKDNSLGNRLVWFSDDGQTWTSGVAEEPPDLDAQFRSVLPYDDGLFLIGGSAQSTLVWTSIAGERWQLIHADDDDVDRVLTAAGHGPGFVLARVTDDVGSVELFDPLTGDSESISPLQPTHLLHSDDRWLTVSAHKNQPEVLLSQ